MSGPTPRPVHWDREFWAAAARGILTAQECLDCGHLQHYPRPACANCLSRNRTWRTLSGHGRVYSFTTVRRPENPVFAAEAPFTLLDVDLEEGLRIVSRLADEKEAPGLRIGDGVTAVFRPVGDGSISLPFFTVTTER
ncbi:MAG: Zn-ribbon domain-containing OB-fold protein [Actinomycetota bacterium]